MYYLYNEITRISSNCTSFCFMILSVLLLFFPIQPPKSKHRFTAITIFFLIHTLSSYLLLTTIVWTRSQLKNLSKDQLIHKVPSLESFKDDIILKLQS